MIFTVLSPYHRRFDFIMDNKKVIRQSNILTTAAYNLNRNEKRLLYIALQQMNDGGLTYNNKENGYEVIVTHSIYGSLFNDSAHASRDIHKAARGLTKESIVFFIPEENGDDGEKATKERNWATGLDHYPKKGQTVIYFNKPVFDQIPHKKGDPFTQYLLNNAGKINNPYAMRLYESICQWRNLRNNFKHDILWMIERFNLPKSYIRMPDFRSKFLKPAIKEINEKTDIFISEPEELCEGARKNTVTHILFKWQEKNKSTPINDPQIILTLDGAIKTYSDLMNKERLPSTAELNNLMSFMGQLMLEGFEFGAEFLTLFKTAQDANSQLDSE